MLRFGGLVGLILGWTMNLREDAMIKSSYAVRFAVCAQCRDRAPGHFIMDEARYRLAHMGQAPTGVDYWECLNGDSWEDLADCSRLSRLGLCRIPVLTAEMRLL